MDMITKHLEFDCGCSDDVEVRPKEARTLLQVGRKTGCDEHGIVTITVAKEVSPAG